jgi:uncharacterized protein
MHVALMAKAPVAHQAKTRLIPALGADGAAALALRLLQHAVAEAVAAQLGPVTVWASPDCTHPAFVQAQALHGVQLQPQAPGDLGQRMAHVFASTRGPVLLMGTDLPGITRACLRSAAALLHTHDVVLLPALDGGYGLIGLHGPAPTLFVDMPWSTAQVLALTRQRIQAAGLRQAELGALPDIDEPADLQHLPAHWR